MVGLPVYPARPATFQLIATSTGSTMSVGSSPRRLIRLVTGSSADTRLAALASPA